MGGLTLDTGALIALERNRKGMSEVVRAATDDGLRIIVPAIVLSEWWRGRTDRRDYVLGMVEIKDVNAKIGKLAVTVRPGPHLQGAWRGRMDRAHVTRASFAGVVVEDGVSLEAQRSDGDGVRSA
jgi:hypothetical protein